MATRARQRQRARHARHAPQWIAVVCVSLLAAGAAWAGDVSVSADLQPTVVPVGGEAMLTVTVEGKFRRSADPQLPVLEDFDVYQSGSSQNFSFINGAMTSSVTYNYTLVAKKEGLYKIGPIRFVLDDKEYSTQPVSLEVVAALQGIAPPQAPQQSPGRASGGRTSGGGAEEAEAGKRSIFIKASVDRDTVYVNQQVTWTLGYYTDGRINLLRAPNYAPPEAEGLWVEDLPPQNKYNTNIGGRQYLVNEIRRGYFPTSSGVHEVGPARVGLLLDDMSLGRSDDFFSRSPFSRGFGRAQELSTEAKQIVVLPLPAAGKPAGFSGVVAENLTLMLSAEKNLLQVGEPVNVTIEINGIGNMKTVAAPPLEGLDGFKTYESGSHFDVFKKQYVVSGRKRYDYVLIPQSPGRQTIPPVSLSYFDPVAKRYLVAQSLPVQLDVQPGTKEEGRKVIYAGAGEEFEVIDQDIRFIHPVPSSLAISSGELYQNRAFLALHALPLFAVGLSLVVEKRRRRFRENVGLARASRAQRDAEKRFSAAGRQLQAGRAEDAFSSVASALRGYLADKMNAPAAGLTTEAVDAFLARHGVEAKVQEELRALTGACDAARFASGGASVEAGREVLSRARNLVRALEKESLR
jgi:hypothetical protein